MSAQNLKPDAMRDLVRPAGVSAHIACQKLRAVCLLATFLIANFAHAAAERPLAEEITIPASGASGVNLTGYFYRPTQPGPYPAIIALHGCGGLLGKSGQIAAREADWAERLATEGYAVLLLNSFAPRGFRQICTKSSGNVTPTERADDVAQAMTWLATQPHIDETRLALIGWSHGAMTVLSAIRPNFMSTGPDFKTAIAFYPGCRATARDAHWKPRMPLTILMGSADNWTEPEPCRALAARAGARFISYEGAVHGFDAPNAPRRTRTGLARPKDGRADVGTDPVARAAAIQEVLATLNAALKTK
ncbi:MAG: dienelactone hydrolase family protein [Hyphomicrobiaceae bacterium]